MSSTAQTGTATPSSPREGSWRGSSDILLDAFETLLQEGDLSYTMKRHSGGKWSSEELLSSCQALLDDARDVVLSVESPGDSSAKRVKSWLKQTLPRPEAPKARAAQANYILGPSRKLPGFPQRSSQAFERNIDNIFDEVEVECDSAKGKSVTTTSSNSGDCSAILRPRSFDELSDTDSYSSFESYDRFDPEEVLVSDSEDECFLQFESCSSGSDEESEVMADDRFSVIDTGNEGDVETTTDAGSNYSVFTTSAEDLWQYNPSYGETSPPSTMSPGLLTPPSLELNQGSSDETLRALSALGDNSSDESSGCCPDITTQSENKLSDVLAKSQPPCEAGVTAATSPPTNKQVDVPRGIQGPPQPQGEPLPGPRNGMTALSRAQPTNTGSVKRSTAQECTAAAVTVGDTRMSQRVPQEAAAVGGSGGGVVQPQPMKSVSGTVPVEPPRREQQQTVAPPPPPGPAADPAASSVAAAPAAAVPRHWSNTIANLPHADSEVDFLDHQEDMADIFGSDTSTLKRRQHRDTVLFNEDFKILGDAQEAQVTSPNSTEEVFGHVRYSDGYEDDSLAYANVLVVNREPTVMEASATSPEREEASRIMRGRRPAPQPPATPTPPSTPLVSPSRASPSQNTSAASAPCRSHVGTPKPVHQTASSASSSGRNSPYAWVRLGPKRPAPLPPVFLPYKKAPAPPPPTGDSNTLKRKQQDKLTQINQKMKCASNEVGPGGPVAGASPGARPSSVVHASPARVVEEHRRRWRNNTETAQDQDNLDYSEIYSDLYGFKYQGGDAKSRNSNNSNGTLKQSKENESGKQNIYLQLGLSGGQFEGPMFGGDGSVVTKLGDEDFLVKTGSGEEFLVTSIGGDEYLVSSINVDKDDSKKTVEDISIIKNTDGIFSLKDKGVLKSSSKSRVNKHGNKTRRSNSSGSKSPGGHSAEGNKGSKSCREHSVEESRLCRGNSVECTGSSSDNMRGSVTEGRHSRSAVAAATGRSTATTTVPSHSHGYKQLPHSDIMTFDNKTNITDRVTIANPETVNCNKSTSTDKCENLNRKSDYVTTIYVQDIESPTGVKGVRNYGTVRATTVNTTKQDTLNGVNRNKNDNEKDKVKSVVPNIVSKTPDGEQEVSAEVLSRPSSAGTSVSGGSRLPCVSGTLAAAGPWVPPCDSSECQVSPPVAAAAAPLVAEAEERRPSGGHDAVRAPRDAPSQQRPHADTGAPHAVGYATLLLGEHFWTYPVFGTVDQCRAPTQEWTLVVQGRGWGIVPCDSDLVLKYSDTMDGMHTKQNTEIIGANVNGLGEPQARQNNDNVSVHGFKLVQSECGSVNNLLPVFDSVGCYTSVRDMSGAVTYRVKPDETWHQPHHHHRVKRNSDLCDMTMYRDPPLQLDAGGGAGPDSGELTPATSSRSIRLCGVALGAPLTASEPNPFRRHTLPRKVRLCSLPPRPGDSSPTPPPPPPAQVSAPSSPKVKKPPVGFFLHQQHPQHQQSPPESLCTDSGAATPTNISPVTSPSSEDSGCTTPTESCAYATPPGGSAATTPSESSAYVTAAEVIIHDANENLVNKSFTNDSDFLTTNKQNVMNRLTEVVNKCPETDNSKINHNIENIQIPSVCINKENVTVSSPSAVTSEPISPEPEPPPEEATSASHDATVTTTSTHSPVSSKDGFTISEEHITHALPTHLAQPVLESTINTLESEKALAVKCIHESSSNLCPLVTISDVATHKEVAILPAPAITVHSTEDTDVVANKNAPSSIGSNDTSNQAISDEKVVDNSSVSVIPSSTAGNLEAVPPRLARKCSDGSKVALKTSSSDCGKSMETIRSPTPSDLERRPSFNKTPTPFTAGKSNTLPRTETGATLNLETCAPALSLCSDTFGYNKAKSASSLLSSENTSTIQDSGQSPLELFAAGTVSNKGKVTKDSNDCKNESSNNLFINETSKSSVKAKSASSLVCKSPLEVFAAGTLPNEQCEIKMEVDTCNQSSKLTVGSNDTNVLKTKSNVSNNQTVDNEEHRTLNINDKLNETTSKNMQNVDCISSKQISNEAVLAHDNENSNIVMSSPGVAKCSRSKKISSDDVVTHDSENSNIVVSSPGVAKGSRSKEISNDDVVTHNSENSKIDVPRPSAAKYSRNKQISNDDVVAHGSENSNIVVPSPGVAEGNKQISSDATVTHDSENSNIAVPSLGAAKSSKQISSDSTLTHDSENNNIAVASPGASKGSKQISDSAVAPDSENGSSVVLCPGDGLGSSSGSTSVIPFPLPPEAPGARCNQDGTPDNLLNVVECSSSLEQTNTCATKNNATTDATQIHRDTNQCRETAAVDTTAAASITPCGDGGGGAIQNMAAGGSIIIPRAARDQADDKDEVIAAAAASSGSCQVARQQQDTLQHVTSNIKDVSADSRPGPEGPGPPTADKASTEDTTTYYHLSDSGSQATDKDHQQEDLVLGEAQSPQGIAVDDTVRQNEVQQLSVDVASTHLASHIKPDLLTDCDIIDLNYSQYETKNKSSSPALDTGTNKLEVEIKSQADKNVIDYVPSESNKINAANTIQTHSIAIPNANDDNINIPHAELFINEDEINIPVKGTFSTESKDKENICKNVDKDKTDNIENETTENSTNKKDLSKDSTETEKSLNDSLSEGLRAIAKSSSFSSKPRGATISNCAALIALTGSVPKPQSHFPMDIICQSKKPHNARQRLATTLGEPIEQAVFRRRRQSSLGHVDPNQSTDKEAHSESRSSSASRIGYRHSTAFGEETSNITSFDLKQTQKSESHAMSNKDIRRISPVPPQQSKPPFMRGRSFDSSETHKKVAECSKTTPKDHELGTKTDTLSTKPPIKQTDNKAASPLPPIRAAKEKDKKNIKEFDDNTKKVQCEKKTEVFSKENIKEVQLPLIHRLVSQNMEDLNREKELESMSQDLEDLQREKELESRVTHIETQISLPQPKEDRVEVSTHIFTTSENESILNSLLKLEVSERPTCIPSIEVLDGSDSIDCSKKISLDSEHIHKNSIQTDHLTTVTIPIIIETHAEENDQQNIESGPSSLDQSQDEEVYEAALEIAELTPAFSSSSTSITTVIHVDSSTPTSVTPTPALTPDINQKGLTEEENEEQFEDAHDELKGNEKANDTNNLNSNMESHSIVGEGSGKSSTPHEEIIHIESSQKALEEPILIMSEDGSVSSGGVVTDPEMLASASASLSSASSWASNGGPVARRDYPLDEDEEELRWKALLAANEIDTESGNDGGASEDDFDAMDEEMRRLEEKLKIFENELGDSVEPSCPSDNEQTSASTSSRPLFKPEDIEGLRISPLPKVYPTPSMNRTKHFSLMSKMEIEQYGESGTESEDNSDSCSEESEDFLYVKKKLKLKPGDRRCRSHYLIRPKNMNVLNSKKASIDNNINNKMDEELQLSGIVSQNDHNDTFDEGFSDKVDILPPQEFSENYEIPSDNPVKLHKIQEEYDETESIEQQYEDFGDMGEENIMFYGNEEEPLLGYMWYEDDGMTAVDFDGPEELQNYIGQGALFFIFEDDLDEPECMDPIDYDNTEETPQIISETKYIENVKEKEKSPKQKDSERTFVSAFKNSLRKASKYLGPKIDTNQKKRSRSASASRHKRDYNTEDITTKNMHLLPAPDNTPERRRSAALDDYKDYSGVYNVRSGMARPNSGPMSDNEGPDISCSSGEYYASPALCVNTSDEDPSIAIPPPPTIPPPPLPPVPPPRWSRWEPIEAPQSPGADYGCWFENTQENPKPNEGPAHSTECNPNLDGNEMQFYLVGTPQNLPGNVYEDVQVTIEPESIDSEPISVEQIQTGAVYGEPYIKMTGWDPENCCDYEYIDTLACVGPTECIQQHIECIGDEMSYSDAHSSAPSHRPTSLKQLKRKQQEKAQRQEAEEDQNNQECNTCIGVPVKRGRPAQEETSHGRQVSPHPKAIGDRRSWPPRK